MSSQLGLGTRLRHLIHELDSAVQDAYDTAGVNFRPRFFPVVRMLLANGAMGIVDLAQASGVSQPAMTQTVGEMEKSGLLVRIPSEDGRSRRVDLSEHGRAIASALQVTWSAVDKAARELDEELPISLFMAVDAALAALQDVPFKKRIERYL